MKRFLGLSSLLLGCGQQAPVLEIDLPQQAETNRAIPSTDPERNSEREEELLNQIVHLQDLLTQKDALLLSRQEELLRFQAALAMIQAPPGSDLAIEAKGPTVDSELASRESPPDPAQVRAEEIRAALQGLLAADGVHSYQVLTLGRLEQGYAGPVVLRLIDSRGRPAGLIAAERLRLEASRAGRTVTLRLEEGYEERAGVSVPFDGAAGVAAAGQKPRGGMRRVTLPGVDPVPWIEAMPELFGAQASQGPPDDGLWDLTAVRQEFNRLLAADPSVGRWRLAGLGGLVSGVLRDVQLVELDADGHPLRRLFADALSLETGSTAGLRIELTDGVQMVGQERTPFLEGRFRLILPRAEPDVWKARGMPGLVNHPALLARERFESSNAPGGD